MSAQYPTGTGGQGANGIDPGAHQSWPNIFGLSQQSQPMANLNNGPNQNQYTTNQPSNTSGWNNGAGQSFLSTNQQGFNALRPDSQSNTSPSGSGTSDPVLHFFNTMPTQQDDPARHQMWTELVRLKTRALELQIAEAKAKEKEAEAELMRLKDLYRSRGGRSSFSQPVNIGQQQQQQQVGQQYASVNNTNVSGGAFGQAGLQSNQPFNTVPTVPNMTTGHLQTPSQNSMLQLNASDQTQVHHVQPPTSMTTFDLEAMMQNNNLDNLFSWLPDFGDSSHSQNTLQGQAPSGPAGGGVDPNDLLVSTDPFNPFYPGQNLSTPMSVKPNLLSPPPPARRSRTPEDDDPPSAKRAKRPEKKVAVEHTSNCRVCSKPLARTITRATKSQIPDHVSVDFTCTDCRAVPQPPALNDVPAPASGSGIGTVDTRKRLRIAMETEDEERKEVDGRRAFCDVCQRVFGSGIISGGGSAGQERENLAHMTEIICASCDAKYARCTDCGGGGGGRMGIGKWRMKQVFQPGRKTCSMSHTRLGDRPREIGVHVTPTDFTPEQLKEVLARCKQLWNEKTLARLAVPEMLEYISIDLPPQLMNPIRNYADVEDIVTQNWPNRESMIRAEGADPARFKRLLGLVWAHSKSRRGTRTVDIEEEWHKTAEGEDDDDMSTVLDNVKRTNLVIPGGSELIGMWGGEWDLKHGALLVSTFIPFEGTDGEDSTAVSVGEMITKVQAMRQAMNQERKADAAKRGVEPDLVPQCEHLWVVSGGAMPLVRERIADILIRKRSFVHVDEYLTRHPDFINALNARPVGLHPDVLRVSPHTAENRPPPLVLVRWLGKDFDAQKIREIKQAEFGGKAKLKKKTKGK